MKAGRSLAWVLSFVFLALPLFSRPKPGTFVPMEAAATQQRSLPASATARLTLPTTARESISTAPSTTSAFSGTIAVLRQQRSGSSPEETPSSYAAALGPSLPPQRPSNANDVWCSGGNGAAGCVNHQNSLQGRQTQHTRILGENYASCSDGKARPTAPNSPRSSAATGVWTTLNLRQRPIR